MELVRVKINETGEVVVMGRMEKDSTVRFLGAGDKLYAPSEVEVLEELPQPKPTTDNTEQTAMDMVQFMASVLNDILNRQDLQYWQRQRVEIAKIILQRDDTHPFADIRRVVDLADQYINLLMGGEGKKDERTI